MFCVTAWPNFSPEDHPSVWSSCFTNVVDCLSEERESGGDKILRRALMFRVVVKRKDVMEAREVLGRHFAMPTTFDDEHVHHFVYFCINVLYNCLPHP